MSLLWEIGLYKKLSKTEAECQVCNRKLKLSNGSTGGLKIHLKIHPEYAEKYKNLNEKNVKIDEDMRKFVNVNGSGITFCQFFGKLMN
jgi:translation elongation factor EF-1alpha